MNPTKYPTVLGIITAATMTLAASTVMAAGTHGSGHGNMSPASMHGGAHGGSMHGDDAHSSPAGEPGKASEATRTVTVEMTDNRYTPETLSVKQGETIRFVVENKGQLVHEFNIGTPAMHTAHQKEMMMMAEHGALEADRINHDRMKMDMGGGRTMEHNDPNSVLLEPGKKAEVVWKFTEAGKFEFACNVPGHYDAGMVGTLDVQ